MQSSIEKLLLLALVLVVATCSGCGQDTTSVDGDSGIDHEQPVDGDEDMADLDQDLTEEEIGEEPEADEIEAETEEEVTIVNQLWNDWEASGTAIGDMLGVASHMKQSSGDDENRNFEFAQYKSIGKAIVREHFRWNHVEPEDDQWNFEAVQTQVDMALANNVRLIPQVGYDVDWAKTGEGDSSLIPEEYGEFTRKVAEKYCSVIKDYELWNEPDMTIFWEPAPNPEHYGKLVKQAYTNIKEVCPDARISLGGLASYSNIDYFDRWWFLRGLYEAHPDIANYFDIVSLHPYTWLVSEPPEFDNIAGSVISEDQVDMIQKARDIMKDMGKEDAPIWFTEIGWPTMITTEETVARWITRSVLLAARDNIEAWLWYTFYDDEPEPGSTDNWGNFFGLFGWPGDETEPRRVKKTWEAFKALSDVMGDATFARDLSAILLDIPNDVHVFGFLREDKSIVIAAWDGREKGDIIDGEFLDGGTDTTFELELPLPDTFTQVKIMDSDGKELSSEDLTDQPEPRKLGMTLDINVRYIELK